MVDPEAFETKDSTLDLRLLDAALAATDEGYCRLDREGRLLDVNAALCRTSGYGRSELLEMSIHQLEAVRPPEAIVPFLSRIALEGSLRFRTRHLRKDGTQTDVEVHALHIRQQEQCIAFIRDISAQIRTEQALGAAERRFETLLRHQGEGFAIVDGDERFTFANPAAEAIFDVSPGTLVGRVLTDFLEEDQRALVHEQTRLRKTGETDTYELRIRRPGGEARHLWVTVTPDTDSWGVYGGAAGFFRDITDRKCAEAALRASEARLRQLIEEAPVAIALTRDTRFLQVNPRFQALHGCASARDLLGKSIFDRVHPDDLDRFSIHPDHVVLGIVPDAPMEYRAIRLDGTPFPMSVTARSLVLEDGPAVLGFFEDIQARRQAEEERERLIRDLQKSMEEVRVLSGLLPICSYCKKIRDDQGGWSPMEAYVSRHTGAAFTHGVCPACTQAHFPEMHQDGGQDPGASGR